MGEIEVHAADEHGRHIARHIVGDPPATDHTVIATAELAALRAEIARLRAGESDHPAAAGVTRTPAEWIHQWNRATAGQRLTRVEQILADAGAAFRCQQQDHDPVLQELANALQIIARVRALHPDDHGLCGGCTNAVGVPSPCDTTRALNGETT